VFKPEFIPLLDLYDPVEGSILLGDNSVIKSIGVGYYGSIYVVISNYISNNLLSVRTLTKDLHCLIYFHDNKSYITTIKEDEYNHKHLDLITTCTLNTDDCLYHVDDMKVFKTYICNNSKHNNIPSKSKLIINDLSTNLVFTDKPYSAKEIKEGSTKIKYKSTRKDMNLKEWLHVRLNHASEAVIDWVVQNNICLGVGVTWSEIKNLHLGTCDTCLRSQMRKFDIPPSISRKSYGIFEFISGDYIKFKKQSIRKFTGAIIYVDKCTGKLFEYKVKAKSEWLSTLKRLIKEYGRDRYPRCMLLRYLLTDFATEVHSNEFTEFLSVSNIELLNSAPYRHEQNLVERHIQTLKNKLRSALVYNRAPYTYWCFALTYVTDTYNMLPRLKELLSPNEAFFGEKQDVSKCVPFYSSGWYYVTPEERLARPSNDVKNLLDERSEPCVMLGYTNPYVLPDKTQARIFIKNAYIVYNPITNKQLPRHDCLFKNYS
jgi:hypothetical protein